MRYRHLIWDFDGTLFDTYPVMARAFYETLQAAGYPADEQAIYQSMKIAISETLRTYQQEYGFGQDLIEGYRAHRVALERELVKPFPGALSVLEQVLAAGGEHFICTHRGNSIHALLGQAGMDVCFKDITTAAHGFARKPSPEAVQYLLKKHGMNPAETLMIGDRPLDIAAGQNAGTHGCFFDPEGKCFEAAQYQITDLHQLLKIVGL